jgi:hypothetical protein
MPYRVLQQGIEAVQAGSTSEGLRLIRIALKDDGLSADLKAVGWLWLAEYAPDTATKRAHYNSAIAADPTNPDARARLARLLSPSAPAQAATPATPAAASPAPAPSSGNINIADHVASIIGGPRGAGTAFFVSADGLLATTRAVTGGRDHVTVDLHSGRQVNGLVVRSFPELDLSLVRVDAAPPFLLPIIAEQRIPDEAPLWVFHYSGEGMEGAQRPTRRVLAAHWIPTTFKALQDAGGGLLFDGRGLLAGMITRSTSQTSEYFYGLNIYAIRAAVERFQMEQVNARRAYCPACGSSSAAGGAGYFYCETCGTTLPAAQNLARYPVPQAATYYERGTARCSACGSAAGIYAGRCLRCGKQQGTAEAPPAANQRGAR